MSYVSNFDVRAVGRSEGTAILGQFKSRLMGCFSGIGYCSRNGWLVAPSVAAIVLEWPVHDCWIGGR